MNSEELSPALTNEDLALEPGIRPQGFDEFVGQDTLKENLGVYIEAARKRAEALDHVLFSGPPGLGKTTLSHILAKELGVQIRATSGPVIERQGVLMRKRKALRRAKQHEKKAAKLSKSAAKINKKLQKAEKRAKKYRSKAD